jgi:hypothetical protein
LLGLESALVSLQGFRLELAKSQVFIVRRNQLDGEMPIDVGYKGLSLKFLFVSIFITFQALPFSLFLLVKKSWLVYIVH